MSTEISHFYPDLFISLTYILASGSAKVNPEKERGSAVKNVNFTFGYLVGRGSLRVRTKGKSHFKLINYPMA